MSISGKQTINVGQPNQPVGSDSLLEAFNKIENNFTTLFSQSSPFVNFVAGNGVSVATDSSNGTITVTNTGVTELIAGTNISLTSGNGQVTISAAGGNNGGGTVTSVGIASVSTDRLTVSGSPIVSSGIISIDLAETAATPGTYTNPTLTVDQYGRVSNIASGTVSGTVTSVGLTAGSGIAVSGSPITSSGIMTITNTGVTRLSAGSGISLSSGNGNVTISAVPGGTIGTVSSIGISSNNLSVTGSPVTTSGTIAVNLPDNVTITGNLTVGGTILNPNLGDVSTVKLLGGTNGFVLQTDGTGNLTWTSQNGNASGNSSPAGSNTQVQFNDAGDFGGNAGFTFNATTGNLSVPNFVIANVNAANIVGFVANANTAITVSDNAQPNITSVGTLTELEVAGNLVASDTTVDDIIIQGDITYDRVFGCFHKVANVTFAAANTVAAFDWFANTTAHVGDSGVTVSSGEPTRINIEKSGNYMVAMQIQATNTGNQPRTIWIWIAKNGTDLPETAVKVNLLKEEEQLSTKEWLVEDVEDDDYIEIRYAVSATTNILFQFSAASSSPFVRPAVPSIVLTVVPVGA